MRIFISVPALAALCLFFNPLPASSLPSPDLFPKGWKLQGSHPKDIEREYRVIEDRAGAYRGETYAFVRGNLMSEQMAVSAGDELEITFHAKSPDSGEVSCMLYTYYRTEEGSVRYAGTMTGFTGKTAPEWTPVTGTFTIRDKNEEAEKSVKGESPAAAVVVVLTSLTGAYFDFPSVAHVKIKTRRNPECARHEGRGRLKLSQGDFTGAKESLNAALRLAETEEEKNSILARMEETGRAEKIRATAEKTEKIFPAIDALVKQGRYADAREEYEKIKELSDRDYLKELALFNIAELYRLEKDYGKAHRTYGEIFSLPELTPYYRIYGLFRQAEAFIEQKDYNKARELYGTIMKTEGALESHLFKSRLCTGDTYRSEGLYSQAREIYERLLRAEESCDFPHEGYRREIIERLESIEGLADGTPEKRRQDKLAERINSPKKLIFISPRGSDSNNGTREKPFASIERAREEVRRIKNESGMPEDGIAVCLRAGKYFVGESILFGKEDSGTADAPVVYRSYPGEEARIIGGRQITDFKLLDDPEILKRLPGESRGRVWMADLKEAGITNYGEFLNRGGNHPDIRPGTMEMFFNTRPMHLARWPGEGWENVSGLVNPEGDGKAHGRIFQKGRFVYSGKRPERWTEEKEIWAAGYFYHPWNKLHTRVVSIDTENRIITLSPDTRWPVKYPPYDMYVNKGTPYYVYNLLSELSAPGEFYVDREEGKLYFYPPDKIEGSEIIVSTLNAPIIEMKDVSDAVLFGLTIEATWRKAVRIENGSNNLIAGCTMRNTGNMGIHIDGGWNNTIAGCDIYDTGEGGILVAGGDEGKLLPAGHCVENNHLYRFNRFSHGNKRRGINIYGSGIRVSRNLLHDSPYIAVYLVGTNHAVEYNEIYDAVHEGRDGGAIYNHSGAKYLMDRGNVYRYNFIHHITEQSSPQKFESLVTGLYIDGLGGGSTMEGNIFYRCTERAMYIHGPDQRVENSFFIDNYRGIYMVDRSYLLDATRVNTLLPRTADFLKKVRYKQPPWSRSYPRLVNLLEDKLPLGRTENGVIERNVIEKTPFLRIPPSVDRGKNGVSDNWKEGSPFFVDAKRMDFRLRTGSPVFGLTGAEPVPFERIGVYESPLRASWPVKRTPAGKYMR